MFDGLTGLTVLGFAVFYFKEIIEIVEIRGKPLKKLAKRYDWLLVISREPTY